MASLYNYDSDITLLISKVVIGFTVETIISVFSIIDSFWDNRSHQLLIFSLKPVLNEYL